MNSTFPLTSDDIEINNTTNKRNYSFFLEHSNNNECKLNFKKCGILDSIGI